MRLKSIRIKNFLSFGSVPQELRFEDDSRISFIVGPNNSGKSNIFRTLGFVAEAIGSGYPAPRFDPNLISDKRELEITVR
jgi:AAA15 family ATPase/GTPase